MKRVSIHRVASAVATFLFLGIFLELWEYLPSVPSISGHTFLNTYFISDPTQIASEVWSITFGNQHGFLWPYLFHTIYASAIAIVVGISIGYVLGVLLSEVKYLDYTFRPFIIFALNVPIILIIPIIIIIFGFGVQSEVISSIILVIIIIFQNAYHGGQSIDPALLSFVKVLGGRRRDIFFRLRLYNALVWVAAQIPSAVGFGLIGVITAEVLGTGNGIGYLITIDLSDFDTSQLFALIFVVSVYGFAIVMAARYLVKYAVKWKQVT